MNREEFNQIVTQKDLEFFGRKIISEIRNIFHEKLSFKEQFYSPKEFARITSMQYSTVVYHCKVGKLKARQNNPNGCWQIDAAE